MRVRLKTRNFRVNAGFTLNVSNPVFLRPLLLTAPFWQYRALSGLSSSLLLCPLCSRQIRCVSETNANAIIAISKMKKFYDTEFRAFANLVSANCLHQHFNLSSISADKTQSIEAS